MPSYWTRTNITTTIVEWQKKNPSIQHEKPTRNTRNESNLDQTLANNMIIYPFYSHLKPGGTSFWHALRIRLRETGMLRLIPSTLALMAVQRQRAASKSANPWSKAQHLLEGGVQPITLTRRGPSAQTPSFNVSLGQEAGVAGGGHGGGLGLHELQAVVNVEWKRRVKSRKRAQSL